MRPLLRRAPPTRSPPPRAPPPAASTAKYWFPARPAGRDASTAAPANHYISTQANIPDVLMCVVQYIPEVQVCMIQGPPELLCVLVCVVQGPRGKGGDMPGFDWAARGGGGGGRDATPPDRDVRHRHRPRAPPPRPGRHCPGSRRPPPPRPPRGPLPGGAAAGGRHAGEPCGPAGPAVTGGGMASLTRVPVVVSAVVSVRPDEAWRSVRRFHTAPWLPVEYVARVRARGAGAAGGGEGMARGHGADALGRPGAQGADQEGLLGSVRRFVVGQCAFAEQLVAIDEVAQKLYAPCLLFPPGPPHHKQHRACLIM